MTMNVARCCKWLAKYISLSKEALHFTLERPDVFVDKGILV